MMFVLPVHGVYWACFKGAFLKLPDGSEVQIRDYRRAEFIGRESELSDWQLLIINNEGRLVLAASQPGFERVIAVSPDQRRPQGEVSSLKE